MCRVPLKKRGEQQRITPDVQTGCISCATGDSKSGAPIWWNSKVDDEGKDNDNDNVATWNQVPLPLSEHRYDRRNGPYCHLSGPSIRHDARTEMRRKPPHLASKSGVVHLTTRFEGCPAHVLKAGFLKFGSTIESCAVDSHQSGFPQIEQFL
jgi:hypothetical protein